MRSRVIAVGLLFGGALFVAGCSSISSGTVTGKAFEPSSSYWISQCFSYDKNGFCSMSIPVEQTDPECYRLDLDNGEDTGSVCVSEADYGRYGAGDHYPKAG